ncbi:MAG: class I SAM-dependent methyltransferase [Anaerolineaceae bacterium]|nr:class I SAM-dependent methyltransferase [Anaerolineaceae bacterium]MCB9102225.1 class I SAM-dependent methyltransferase [Anaerolineales bacterium]
MNQLACNFYEQLETEVLEGQTELDSAHYACLKHYYSKWLKHPELRPFYSYNWMRRTGPMQRLILSLPRRGTPWRILDAGCGVGTESIFWSTLRTDLEVVGVDVAPDRLKTARARHRRYQQRLGQTLNIRFVEANIFKMLEAETFDLVWTMEAISHVDPAEDFMRQVFENFDPHGYLVISDSHILNPAMAWRIYRMRRQGVAEHAQKTLASGEVIAYAQERLFSVSQLARILKQIGFRSVESQLSIFMPPVAFYGHISNVCRPLDHLLNKLPGIRHLGGIYTVTATK